MRYRVILLTDNHEALLKALDKASVSYTLATVANNAMGQSKLNAEQARAVYDTYATGRSARATAEAHGLSVPTVQRVVANPQAYGVNRKAIRRMVRGSSG